jgi:hypothetical protein
MIKLPIFNDHKCKGLYDDDSFCPEHYCWIPHILLGGLSIYMPILTIFFVMYQISQMIIKRELWDDLIDIIEFFIGRIYFIYLLKFLKSK